MVLGADDVLSPVVQLAPVDDEGVVVARVPLHVLDALLELLVVVEPGERGRRYGDHPARELDALALVRERALGLDDEPWRRLPAI